MNVESENTLSRYRGVKGWLLVLCVCLTILDPVAAIVNLFVVVTMTRPLFEKSPALLRLITVSGACTIALVLFGVYAGLSMWKVVPNAVRIARRYFLAVFYYSIFAIYLPNLVGMTGDSLKEMKTGSLINNVRTILYIAMWYVYLLRSKRVKATYGGEK
jgi:hypothetical protein